MGTQLKYLSTVLKYFYLSTNPTLTVCGSLNLKESVIWLFRTTVVVWTCLLYRKVSTQLLFTSTVQVVLKSLISLNDNSVYRNC